MNDTTHLPDLRVTDEAVNREVLGPIARRIANNRNRVTWLESHLEQYSDAVLALGNRSAS
jgi:hypothetical protein